MVVEEALASFRRFAQEIEDEIMVHGTGCPYGLHTLLRRDEMVDRSAWTFEDWMVAGYRHQIGRVIDPSLVTGCAAAVSRPTIEAEVARLDPFVRRDAIS